MTHKVNMFKWEGHRKCFLVLYTCIPPTSFFCGEHLGHLFVMIIIRKYLIPIVMVYQTIRKNKIVFCWSSSRNYPSKGEGNATNVVFQWTKSPQNSHLNVREHVGLTPYLSPCSITNTLWHKPRQNTSRLRQSVWISNAFKTWENGKRTVIQTRLTPLGLSCLYSYINVRFSNSVV